MSGPKLSIIIPVYNAQAYIAGNLSALQQQSFQDYEIICVNDASTDGSLGILRQFAQEDPRIRYIDLEQNRGPGYARNQGLEAVRGEYITFLDADDRIEKDLHAQAMALMEESGADEVVWGVTEEHFNRRGRHIRSIPILPAAAVHTSREQIVSAVVRLEEQTLFGYIWNAIYSAKIIGENHIRFLDFPLYEDYFFNLEYIRHTRTLAVLASGGYHYYKRQNARFTRRFKPHYFELSYSRVESFYKFCRENQGLTPENKAVLGRKLLRYTVSAMGRNGGQKGKSRKAWICTELYPKALYEELLATPFHTNCAFSWLRRAIQKKKTGCLAWMMWAIHRKYFRKYGTVQKDEKVGVQK